MSGARRGWLLLLMTGCLSSADVQQQIERSLAERVPALLKPLEEENARLKSQLEKLGAVALCSQDLRQLIALVDKEGCTAPQPQQESGPVCTAQKLDNLISRWDTHNRLNLLRLINRQPHTYVYFGREPQVRNYRERKLQALATDKIGDRTRFLVLGRIEQSEKESAKEAGEARASERTQAVAAVLQSSGVPKAQVVSWNLSFGCVLADIPPEDRPLPRVDAGGERRGEDPLSRLVVVFRVDC